MIKKNAGGTVSIDPIILSRLLRGNIVKSQELGIVANSDTVIQLSIDNIEIGECTTDEHGRLLLSSIYCPSILHYSTNPSYRDDSACPLCGGKRREPTILNTKHKNGQMVCVLALQMNKYRGIDLPKLDEEEQQAATTAAMVAFMSLINGGQ